jgi:small nuclear ribonucleoprotein (snRNP)-like protein
MSGQKPEDFINAITGRPVILKLVTGEIIKGILVSIDSMFFSFLFSSTFSQFFFSIYSPFIPLIPYTNHPFLPISSHPPYPSPSPIIPFLPTHQKSVTMSCVLEQYERFSDGELISAYDKAYVRGSNILYFGINKE